MGRLPTLFTTIGIQWVSAPRCDTAPKFDQIPIHLHRKDCTFLCSFHILHHYRSVEWEVNTERCGSNPLLFTLWSCKGIWSNHDRADRWGPDERRYGCMLGTGSAPAQRAHPELDQTTRDLFHQYIARQTFFDRSYTSPVLAHCQAGTTKCSICMVVTIGFAL